MCSRDLYDVMKRELTNNDPSRSLYSRVIYHRPRIQSILLLAIENIGNTAC